MNIVYDNIIFSLQKAGGISMYWSKLIAKSKNIDFFEKNNQNIFRKKINIKVRNEINITPKLLRYFPFMKKLPNNCIFHSSYYRISLQQKVINITTVHDFTYEYYKTGLPKYIHIWQKKFAIKKSIGIICVSEHTKKDLIKFNPNIDKLKIKVIYNGVGDEFLQLKNASKELEKTFKPLKNKKYILYVGDRSTYKNFDIAVDCAQQMFEFSLVVVGGKEFNKHETSLLSSIENKIFHYRGLDSEKLNILYNNAFCLLYPSSYEGFGIPIVEAMKAGCPVVSVNTSSIPEVSGTAGLLVDKIESKSFIEKIILLENDIFRTNLIKKGFIQSNKFSWEKCYQETYSFYEELYKRRC